MSRSAPGRHRAPAKSPASAFGQLASAVGGTAGAAAKTGAVLAVSGGLVASLGLQANAAPSVPAAGSVRAAAPSVQAAGVPAATVPAADIPVAVVDGVAAAPRYGEIGFTAKATPKPKPKPKLKPKVEAKSAVAAKPAAHGKTESKSAERSSEQADEGRSRTKGAHRSERSTRSERATKRDRAERRERASRSSRSSERSSRRSESSSHARAGRPGSASFGDAVLRTAARYEGIMYVYGGTTPSGFDCSGYTSYVMRKVGISLPRTSGAQRAATRRVSRSEAVPGDLVFMPGHVGIYAGNGKMWDAPRTGKAISKRTIWSSSATFGRVG